MDKKCALCGSTKYLYELEIPVEDGQEGEKFSKWVCGSCWDVISAMVIKIIHIELGKLK
jgi:hypothetical protein